MVTAIDLFCGVGGLSVGLKAAGMNVAAGFDVDEACRYPFEENIGAEFIQADIRRTAIAVKGSSPKLISVSSSPVLPSRM